VPDQPLAETLAAAAVRVSVRQSLESGAAEATVTVTRLEIATSLSTLADSDGHGHSDHHDDSDREFRAPSRTYLTYHESLLNSL
jgi:hypothetical protein